MASFPPSPWAFSSNRTSFSFPTIKPPLFPPTPYRSLKPLLSSPADGAAPEPPDPIKLAFAKAEAYKKPKIPISALEKNPVSDSPPGAEGSGDKSSAEIPASVKLALEKAREYKKSVSKFPAEEPIDSGQEKMKKLNSSEGFVENKVSKKEEQKISNIDFLGFGFSEKKQYRGLPPGLLPIVEPLSEGDLPQVELIVGDASKFETTTPSKMSSNKHSDIIDVYKPKVSTWGIFPRPNDISKTFGGGRVIRPGEVLETAEDKVAKEKRSRELIAAYKNKMGLTIDAKRKFECEKALKEGDKLMDLGKLREALPFYEKVMKELVFQSELHGLAALQWSICEDSLGRGNEARIMYEKLQSHPNVQVSKIARQFVFSFQAMEMMKVTSSSISRKTGYENYFEAFVEKKTDYPPKGGEDEGALRQDLPYIMLLVSPVFIVLFIALRKSFQF